MAFRVTGFSISAVLTCRGSGMPLARNSALFCVHHRLCVIFAQEGKLAVVPLLRFRQRLIPLILAGLEQAGFPAHELPDSGSGLEGGES